MQYTIDMRVGSSKNSSFQKIIEAVVRHFTFTPLQSDRLGTTGSDGIW